MVREGVETLLARHIPDLDRVVRGGGDEMVVVGRVADVQDPRGVTREGGNQGAMIPGRKKEN